MRGLLKIIQIAVCQMWSLANGSNYGSASFNYQESKGRDKNPHTILDILDDSEGDSYSILLGVTHKACSGWLHECKFTTRSF